MKRGNRKTANSEIEVNALAGVRSPPSRVNIPNEITITITGILLSMKLLNCNVTKRVSYKVFWQQSYKKIIEQEKIAKERNNQVLNIIMSKDEILK